MGVNINYFDDYFDVAAKVICLVHKGDKLEKNQIDKLMNQVDTVSANEVKQYISAYILRQISRDIIGKNVGKIIIYFVSNLPDTKTIKEEIRKFLDILKLLYEASEGIDLSDLNCKSINYDKFIKAILERR